MKQYKITFYYNRKTLHPCPYYREFETVKEVKEWAKYWLNENSLFVRYEYKTVPMDEFLNNNTY